VNLDGEVVGINTVIATSVGQYSGVGFAIPINMAKNIVPTLLKGGTVSRGMLGVIIQDITEDLREQFNLPDTKGALVAQINKDSPAEKAGIKVGDFILRFNGTAVEDTRHLRNLVAAAAPGSKVEIVLLRDGKERTVEVTLAELKGERSSAGKGEESEEGANTPDVGLTVEPLSANKAKELSYEKAEGVLITDVDEDSPAAEAGLQPDDLITEVNHEKVTSVDGFRNALAKAKDKGNALLLVKRKDASRFVIVKFK
jgi:serine protease Do